MEIQLKLNSLFDIKLHVSEKKDETMVSISLGDKSHCTIMHKHHPRWYQEMVIQLLHSCCSLFNIQS